MKHMISYGQLLTATLELSLNNFHISGRCPPPAKAQPFVLLQAAPLKMWKLFQGSSYVHKHTNSRTLKTRITAAPRTNGAIKNQQDW